MNIEKKVKEIADTGHFIKIVFVKTDGTIREMTARSHVHKHLKGTGKPITDGRVVLWEPSLNGDGNEKYRSLWPSTVVSVKHGDTVVENAPYCTLNMKPKGKKK